MEHTENLLSLKIFLAPAPSGLGHREVCKLFPMEM